MAARPAPRTSRTCGPCVDTRAHDGAAVLYERATRTSLLRTVRAGGTGQLAPGHHAPWYTVRPRELQCTYRVPCGASQVGPPKTRKGRSHDDDWYQGKFALQADISMVCLANPNPSPNPNPNPNFYWYIEGCP